MSNWDLKEYFTGNSKSKYTVRDSMMELLCGMLGDFEGMLKIDLDDWETIFYMVEGNQLEAYVIRINWLEFWLEFSRKISDDDRDELIKKISPKSLSAMGNGERVQAIYRVQESEVTEDYLWFNVTVFCVENNGKKTIYIGSKEIGDIVHSGIALQKSADKDEMTGLYSYSRLKVMIKKEYAQLGSCGVILFKIADIEGIRQNGGQDMAATAIIQLADSLRALVSNDIHIYRYGFGEFLLVYCNALYGEGSEVISAYLNKEKWVEEHGGLKLNVIYAKSWARIPVSVESLVADVECQIYEILESNNKNISAELEKKNELLEKRMATVREFIKNEYEAIYEINLENDTFDTVISDKATKINFVGMSGKYSDTNKRFVEERVDPEYHGLFEKVNSAEGLRELLKDDSKLEIEYQKKDDERTWRRVTYQVSERDENGAATKALMTNVSIDKAKAERLLERKALSEAYQLAEEASRAKTEFLSRMSHDIRTPMNAIIGMNVIAASHLDDKTRVASCLKKIDGASKHLLSLINDILDLNRIESGREEVNMQEVNFKEVSEALINMAKPQAEQKNIHFEVIATDIENEDVIMDINMVQRIMLNVVGNAIKYTPEGGRIIVSFIEEETQNPNYSNYIFVCQDNGIGMSEDFLGRIFEPFTRSDDSRIAEIQGTGLGMAITKNLVQLMNGTINVYSQENEGTTVTISAPFEKINQKTDKYPELEGKEILVLCSNVKASERIKNMLADNGMIPKMCTSAHNACRVARDKQNVGKDYFAIIMDSELGGISYIDAAKLIRAQIGFNAPIILIEPTGANDHETEARAAGINKSLTKPLFKGALIETLRSLMRNMVNVDLNHLSGNENVPIFNEKVDFAGKRVLLVEDNVLNAEIAIEIMEMTGAEIIWVDDGKKAVDAVSESPENFYDIIFMDIQMPVMNGYEATLAIRELPRRDVSRVPIIALTANAFSSDVQNARNAGMNEHLSKPIEFPKLEAIMKKYLL